MDCFWALPVRPEHCKRARSRRAVNTIRLEQLEGGLLWRMLGFYESVSRKHDLICLVKVETQRNGFVQSMHNPMVVVCACVLV